MANQISGKVIAVSDVKTVASSDPSKPAMKKRELYMDCTRYDPYTGERSQYENKPLLEFGGDKVLAKLEALQIKKDDVVTVSFDIQGTPYTDKQTGKMKVYTAIRCYDIEVRRRADGSVPETQPSYESNHQPTGASPFPPQENAAPADAPVNTDGVLPF